MLAQKKSDKTRRNEDDALTRLKLWCGHMRPDAVTQQQRYQYIDRRRKLVNKKTGETASALEAARHEISLLGHVYKKAICWGVATKNTLRGLKKGGRKEQQPPVPWDQVLAVRELATERMRLAIDLAVCMAPRRGNLLALTRDKCIDDGIEFLNTKDERMQLIEWWTTFAQLSIC